MWSLLVESWRKLCQIIGKNKSMNRNKEEQFLQSTLNSTEKDLQLKCCYSQLEEMLI